jgi:hypothetical protein
MTAVRAAPRRPNHIHRTKEEPMRETGGKSDGRLSERGTAAGGTVTCG